VRTRLPKTLAWYLPLVYGLVGILAYMLSVFALSYFDSTDMPAADEIGLWGRLVASFAMYVAVSFRLKKARWHGVFFIAFGVGMAALGAWVLLAAPEATDGAMVAGLALASAVLAVALGVAALLFPQELHEALAEERKSMWFLGPKKRRSAALVLGLVGAAAGLAAAGSLFPTSIVRGCIGVVLAGLAAWGALLTGKDLTSASLLLLGPSMLGIVITGLRWLPACLVLLFAAISDWPRERERREFRERRG
jgi:hypothetical protein